MELLIIFFLMLLNGVFAMAEIATVSARKNRLSAAAKKGDKAAGKALELSKDPGKFLSSVQIGITLIGILMGIYSGQKIEDDLVALLNTIPLLAPWSDRLATFILLISLTLFSILIGELVPKRIGLARPETMARLLAFPMYWLSRITSPFIWLLTKSSDALINLFNIKPSADNQVTEEEIRALVREGRAAGAIREIEQHIVERVFNLGDRKVGSLMVHRSDTVMLPADASAETIFSIVRDAIHTAYPILDEAGEVKGLVYLKDLFGQLQAEDFKLAPLIRRPIFVFENASAYETLKLFKTQNTHRGIVVNEFGDMQGFITQSDLLEALIGDSEERKEALFEFTQRSDGSVLIDGQYPLAEFLAKMGMDQLRDTVFYHTLSGLLLHELKTIPQSGDTVVWQGLLFEILDMDGARIDKVLVQRKGD